MPKNATEFQIWKLAKDLEGRTPKDNPRAAILEYCRTRVRSWLQEYPCDTLSELLMTAAACLETRFVEIGSNEELRQIRDYYVAKGEKPFALLKHELNPGVLAITFRRLRPGRGEPQFVSVIDSRGDKMFRTYFSKWHEIAHLLTLTDKKRSKFCRTHAAVNQNDAEEVLMESIAAELAFFPDIVRRYAQGPISFEKIEEIRQQLCPQASLQASVNNLPRQWPTPCTLIETAVASKPQARASIRSSRVGIPKKDLRIIRVTRNLLDEEATCWIQTKMQVPRRSIIYKVFSERSFRQGEAVEDLSWWETAKGRYLPQRRIKVSARRMGEKVMGLIVPA